MNPEKLSALVKTIATEMAGSTPELLARVPYTRLESEIRLELAGLESLPGRLLAAARLEKERAE